MESNQRGGVKIFPLEEHIRILCEFGKELGLGIDMKSNAEMCGSSTWRSFLCLAFSVRKQWERGAPGLWHQGAGRNSGIWEELWVEEVGGAKLSSWEVRGT